MPAQQSSMNDVFRFIKIRPITADSGSIKLLDTQYSQSLANATNPEQKRRIANHALVHDRAGLVRMVTDLHFGQQIKEAKISAVTIDGATLRNVLAGLVLPDNFATNPQVISDINRLSDTLLLSRYATTGASPLLDVFRQLYVLYHFLILSRTDPSVLSLPLIKLLAYYVIPAHLSKDETKPERIAAVGIADLLVVKQQIKCYEATEIAHVENIMSGETRTREHRSFERIDETVTIEKEKIVEKEKELETSERFELNKEASKTVKEDQKYAFDLSISANYGPTVEVESSFGLDIATSTETAAKSASKYAKDVIERSLDRVTERVREERIRTIRRETEEKNLHSFVNGDENPHKIGIYQFLDKVYEAQVFNYGKRQIFDLMIPEPASYLWYLSRRDEDAAHPTLPVSPTPLNITANQILHGELDSSRPNHYTKLALKYGATGITPPPAQYKIATATYQTPAAGSPRASEEGEILTAPLTLEIAIEPGYQVKGATFYCIALSDNSAARRIPFSVGVNGDIWTGTTAISHGRLGVNQGPVRLEFPEVPELSTGNKLIVSALPYETANYTLSAEIRCEVSDTSIQAWKLTTFDRIRSAYLDRLMEYKDELSKIELAQKQQQQNVIADFGIPPSKRKQLMLTELKKQCIAIFMQDWFSSSAVAVSGSPPQFDFDEAYTKGNVTRFLEQSIEWTQIQYALYPYFWAQQSTWEERIRKNDADYEFQQFMQAGAARVVIPVRPKFEAAFDYFLETGEVWNGAGTTPSLHDPLYLSIVDELKELSGGSLEVPVPVGEPWEVRLPTNLVLLRETSTLPEWEKEAGTSWDWHPVPDSAE